MRTNLWNISCSALRSICVLRSVSTFSFSFSSNCCVVSMQYSAVQRILQIRHCSSSISFVTSPSLRMLWIRLEAALELLLWPDNLTCRKSYISIHHLYCLMMQICYGTRYVSVLYYSSFTKILDAFSAYFSTKNNNDLLLLNITMKCCIVLRHKYIIFV